MLTLTEKNSECQHTSFSQIDYEMYTCLSNIMHTYNGGDAIFQIKWDVWNENSVGMKIGILNEIFEVIYRFFTECVR